MGQKISQQGELICLRGDLVFSTVTDMRNELETALKNSSREVIVDFSDVGKVDSSALSLWLCIQRYTQQHGITVTSRNIPEELEAISRLVGLDKSGLCLR